MNRFQHIFLIALLFGSAFFFSPGYSCLAQDEVIELVEGAEQLRVDGKTGNYILNGNVTFKKDGATLYCDSAYYNLVNKKIYAFGNVHLNQRDTLNMYCDSLYFDSKNEYSKLWGNVRVRDNEYKLTTDSLDYDIKKDMGVYKNGGVITSITSSERLTSKVGYFYPKNEQFNFRKDVIYSSDRYKVTTDTLQFNGLNKKAFFFGPTNISGDSTNMYCESGWYDITNDEGVLSQNAFIDRKEIYIAGDSLYYSSVDSLYIGRKNVEIRDTSNQLSFFGDYALNDDKVGKSFITGHAVAQRYGKEDTLYIHADTLYAYEDSLQKPSLIQAYHAVELFKGKMSGVCDSLSYNKQRGILNMYDEPIMWAKDAQLSGDTISVYEEDGDIDHAYIRQKGLVVTDVKHTDYFNQVSGTSMTAYFDSSAIRQVNIEKNAKTIYFLEDEAESDTAIVVERKGMNRLYSSDISLYFKDGDLEGASYRSEPDGILYPMDQIDKDESSTAHFKWEPTKRPLSPQFMILDPEEKSFFLVLFRSLLLL